MRPALGLVLAPGRLRALRPPRPAADSQPEADERAGHATRLTLVALLSRVLARLLERAKGSRGSRMRSAAQGRRSQTITRASARSFREVGRHRSPPVRRLT